MLLSYLYFLINVYFSCRAFFCHSNSFVQFLLNLSVKKIILKYTGHKCPVEKIEFENTKLSGKLLCYEE